MMGAGLLLYKWLAGRGEYGEMNWLNRQQLLTKIPVLKSEGLLGGYQFYDGQMDDYQLGLWVAEQAVDAGVTIHENSPIKTVSQNGEITDHNGNKLQFDKVINVAGPWAETLARQSGCKLPYTLDLVRGSHIVVDRNCPQALFLEVPQKQRIFFVLPWKKKTLIGTTEKRQKLNEPIQCSKEESQYLLNAYNYYHIDTMSSDEIVECFAGVRPLIQSIDRVAGPPSKTTREYVIHRDHQLITVLGGKWTTALALSRQVAKSI